MESSKFVACGYDFTICLDSFGIVWSFGNNSFGQLGHGNTASQYSPKVVSTFEDNRIVAISCSSKHSAFVDCDGCVWIAGNTSISTFHKPCKLEINVFITSVSCGYNFTLALDDEGCVWGFGSNDKGQLGIGDGIKFQDTPKRIEALKRIEFAECGNYHSICQDYSGDIWAFGCNHFGQLGLGDEQMRHLPARIEQLGDITQFSCGQNHTVCLDKYGSVWSFGNNAYGQLGFSSTKWVVVPTVIPDFNDVLYVSCGENHTAFIDVNMHLYVCGSNFQGQLGPVEANVMSTPKKVVDSRVECISRGSNHTFYKDQDGYLWAFGDNGSGQLGLGHTRDISCCVRLPDEFSQMFWNNASRAKSAKK